MNLHASSTPTQFAPEVDPLSFVPLIVVSFIAAALLGALFLHKKRGRVAWDEVIILGTFGMLCLVGVFAIGLHAADHFQYEERNEQRVTQLTSWLQTHHPDLGLVGAEQELLDEQEVTSPVDELTYRLVLVEEQVEVYELLAVMGSDQ